jgi:hypothetical protein
MMVGSVVGAIVMALLLTQLLLALPKSAKAVKVCVEAVW